jgi:hypothetical protein
MAKVDERILALEAKLKQLKVQHQSKEARARKTAAKRARHEELRRKILVRAILLAKRIPHDEVDFRDAGARRPKPRREERIIQAQTDVAQG